MTNPAPSPHQPRDQPRAAPMPALGFGVSGPLGARWFAARKTRRLIAAAQEGGIVHFDTAPFYGLAEMRLGTVLADMDSLFISTKTGTRRDRLSRPIKDFSKAAITRDVTASLKALKRSALDLVYLHGPSPDQMADGLETLQALKTAGDIRAIGVCGHAPQLTLALDDPRVDALMGFFNVFDQKNGALFRRAHSMGRHVHTVSPLAQATYTDDFTRMRRPADIWRRARALKVRLQQSASPAYGDAASGDVAPGNMAPENVAPENVAPENLARALLSPAGEDPVATALQFALAQPFIDVVFMTTTNPAHLAHNLNAARRTLDPAAALRLNQMRDDSDHSWGGA